MEKLLDNIALGVMTVGLIVFGAAAVWGFWLIVTEMPWALFVLLGLAAFSWAAKRVNDMPDDEDE